jgi:hypothetical protein
MAVQKVITPVFRMSFPSLFEASSYEGGAPKYSVCAVFDPSKFTEADKKRWDAMAKLADEVSVGKFKKKIAALPANFKKPFRDGEEKADLSGFGEGKIFCNFGSKIKPGIVDRDNTPIVDEGEIYPGCYARATVTCFAYDNIGKGVSFGLQNVQKIKDGERLDNRTDATEDFGDEEIDSTWLEGDEDPLA